MSSPKPILPISPERARRLVQLLQDLDRIENLSNGQLTDAVIEEVWADFDLSSRQSMLLDELINRFEKRVGIMRDEDGKITNWESGWKS